MGFPLISKLFEKGFLKSLALTFASALAFLLLPAQVYALPREYQELFGNGVYYFDPSGTGSETCAVILAGNNNEEKIWNYLASDMKFSAEQTAGVMGNLQAESGLNPKRVQNTPTPEGDRDEITVDGVTGYGLAQWTSLNRQQGLADLAAIEGVISGDLGVQLKYLRYELEEIYTAIFERIKDAASLDQASDIFMTEFERPADQSEAAKEERRKLGRAILTRYGSGTGGGTSESTCELPGGDAAELAQALLASANFSIASTYKSQLENVAAGQGPCPEINNGQYTVNAELLRVLVALAKNNAFTVGSLHRGCTGSTVGSGTASRHWQGKAADVSGASGINGVTMPSFSAHSGVIQKFVNQARELLPADCELGVPNNTYVGQANSSGSSPCTNVFLDTPGTTGATGPHVHIGVP